MYYMGQNTYSTKAAVRLLLKYKGTLQFVLSGFKETKHFLQAINSAELGFTVGRMDNQKIWAKTT